MYEHIETLSKALLLFAAIFILFALGLAVVRIFRGGKADDREDSSELMSKFRDLHSEGGLSDEEYRTIKTKLARELKAELNDTNSAG